MHVNVNVTNLLFFLLFQRKEFREVSFSELNLNLHVVFCYDFDSDPDPDLDHSSFHSEQNHHRDLPNAASSSSC